MTILNVYRFPPPFSAVFFFLHEYFRLSWTKKWEIFLPAVFFNSVTTGVTFCDLQNSIVPCPRNVEGVHFEGRRCTDLGLTKFVLVEMTWYHVTPIDECVGHEIRNIPRNECYPETRSERSQSGHFHFIHCTATAGLLQLQHTSVWQLM